MNILIFNWRDLKHSWAGGGELYVFENASRWVKFGHNVTVFCGQDILSALPEHEVIDGIHVYRKGGRYSLYFWAVWYYFTKFRNAFDVVVDVENGIPFFTPLFCRKPKVCFVYHIHGKQFFYELPPVVSHIGYFIEKNVFPFLYRKLQVVAISETTKQQLIGIGIPAKNISIIYSGLYKSNNISSKSSSKFSHPTLLYLGRIKKYKRVDLLVQLFSQIVKKVPKAKLIIAGWGTEASQLTDIVMRNPLRRKISLMGPVSHQEKRMLLSRSWVFVNPSIGEGWSIAVIEANLYGTPAAAFKVPGLAESIKHNKTGMLADSNNELIDSICQILTKPTLRQKLNVNAKKWANKFNWDDAARQSLAVLKKAQSNI